MFIHFPIGSNIKLFSVVEVTQGQRKRRRSNLTTLDITKHLLLCVLYNKICSVQCWVFFFLSHKIALNKQIYNNNQWKKCKWNPKWKDMLQNDCQWSKSMIAVTKLNIYIFTCDNAWRINPLVSTTVNKIRFIKTNKTFWKKKSCPTFFEWVPRLYKYSIWRICGLWKFYVTFNNIKSNIVAVSFVVGCTQCTWRQPSTCCNYLKNFIT